MRKYWKEITIVTLLALLFWGNRQYDEVTEELRTASETITKLNKQVNEKVDTVVVEKIVEVDKDGTTRTIDRVTDTSKETDIEIVEEEKEIEIEEKIVEKKATKKNFAVTISTPLSIDPQVTDFEITAGTRLLNSNFWLEGGYDLKHEEIKVGVRFEF